ncbi:hypothetical protein [Aliiglaciecola litoralis]|uniref:Uncharacterized protein n=1 Tax=Aliiglaciecola litoralis TaxID=582857 RepID=A0ABN1LE05_9ALTE
MILDALQKLLDYLQKERHAQDEKTVAALNAINDALNETKKYIEFSGGQKCHDREREYQLSRLWDQASVAVLSVKAIDPGFPTALHEKALYWADTYEWTSEVAEKKKIKIEHVEQQIAKLLTP